MQKIYKEDKTFQNGSIYISNGMFAGQSDDECVVDAQGCYAIPGLIDLHFHGCMGYDFCDGTLEAIAEIAKYEASVGVTGISPATMTLPAEELGRILSVGAAYRKQASEGAELIGVNMEGPFISRTKRAPRMHAILFHAVRRSAGNSFGHRKGL